MRRLIPCLVCLCFALLFAGQWWGGFLGNRDSAVENSRAELVRAVDVSTIEAGLAGDAVDVSTIETGLAGVASVYQVEIVTAASAFAVATQYGKIEGKQAKSEAVESYAATVFLPEFGLYPTALVKRSKLRRIVMCEELLFAGVREAGKADYEHGALYLEVSRGDYSEVYQRKLIHHEFFHMLDFQAHGGMYVDDERWSRLNPPNFRYGMGGRSNPGFLSQYSTTAVAEDKAEVFANMIVEPAHVDARVQTDPFLKAKVARMRELLADFCPEVNRAFWAKVALRNAISTSWLSPGASRGRFKTSHFEAAGIAMLDSLVSPARLESRHGEPAQNSAYRPHFHAAPACRSGGLPANWALTAIRWPDTPAAEAAQAKTSRCARQPPAMTGRCQSMLPKWWPCSQTKKLPNSLRNARHTSNSRREQRLRVNRQSVAA